MSEGVVRRADEGDLGGILALMRSEMGWPPDSRAEELWRWKHQQNPFGQSHIWVAVHGGRVIAVRSLMRWEMVDASGAVVACARAVDTVTSPEHRGRGWFRRLTASGIASLGDEGVSFVFNTPNDQSRPGNLSLGWSERERPSVWIRPRGIRSIARLARSRTSAEIWPTSAVLGGDIEGALAACDVDALLRDADPGGVPALSTRRSAEFLLWRYGLPSLGYRAVAGPEGLSSGFSIVRTRRRGVSAERELLDTVGPSRSMRGVLSPVDPFDHAIALGNRPGRGWWKAPGLGPRLVVRSLGAEAVPHLRLTLGDLELL